MQTENYPKEIKTLSGTPFDTIMQLLLQGGGSDMAVLREQYSCVSKFVIEWSGAGYFVDFHFSKAVREVSASFSSPFGTVHGYDGEDVKVGAILFLEDGKAVMLEIYTFTDDFDVNLEKLEFRPD